MNFPNCTSMLRFCQLVVLVPLRVMTSQWLGKSRCLLPIMILSCLVNPLIAAQSGDFTYTSNGTAITITGYTGAGGAVSIPATIENLPVTTIGSSAFSGKEAITSVVIPIGVTSIGSSAYYYCTGLTSVTFPASVTSIGSSAFSDCRGLKAALCLGSAPGMGSSVFYRSAPGFQIYYLSGQPGFTSPTWQGYPAAVLPSDPTITSQPASQTILPGYPAVLGVIAVGITPPAYQWYQGISGDTSTPVGTDSASFTTPALTTSTSYWVRVTNAANPTGLDSTTATLTMAEAPAVTTGPATWPTSSTTTISGSVNPNGATTSVSFEYGTTTAYGMVKFCTAVYGTTWVTYSMDLGTLPVNTIYHYRISATNSLGTSVGEDRTFVTSRTSGDYTYVTSDSYATITGYTGAGGALNIPSTLDGLTVTAIGNDAFRNKTAITSVVIPSGVTSIGSNAFTYCTNLTSVTIPHGVTSIDSGTFSFCTALVTATIPDSVTSIGSSAFSNCTALGSIAIPVGVTTIGFNAFYRCMALSSVMIPANVTSIGSDAFSNCAGLTAITVDFSNANYRSVDGVLFNKDLTDLIQYPGGKAGAYTIPASVTSIGSYAFDTCTGLTSVTIPSSVTSIGNSAFSDCTALAYVTIPAGVISIGSSAFSGCLGLIAFSVEPANLSYSSIDGVLFNKNFTTLVQYPINKAGAYTIPATATSIDSAAFSGSTRLTSVTIPVGVRSIGSAAFSGCTSLTSITIPGSVTSIGNSAFYRCTGLTSVSLSTSVTSIGMDVFGSCVSLTGITIPASVFSIGSNAFSYCISLKKVLFLGRAPSMVSSAFSNTNSSFTVYFITGSSGFTTPTWRGYPAVALSAGPLLIISDPKSVTITPGATATLTVTAIGTGPFTYQWYQGSTGTTTTPVGADSPSFTTPALSTSTSYWAKVTNSGNPSGVNSNTANVTVSRQLVPNPVPAYDGSPGVANKPVKVYIMAGDEGMLSRGKVSGSGPGTLNTIVNQEAMFPGLSDGTGGWVTRNDVHVHALQSNGSNIRKSPLSPTWDGDSIGPELGFGQVMGWYHDEPVLLIRASNGGRALGWDLLPPGSDRFDWTNGRTYPGYGESPESWVTGTGPTPFAWYAGKEFDSFFRDEADMGPTITWQDGVSYPNSTQLRHNGVLYISKQAHTAASASEPGVGTAWATFWSVYSIHNTVDFLDNFATEYPQWAAQGFEIAGYVWWQGVRDGNTAAHAAKYQENMAQYIKQIRHYYATRYPGQAKPDAPFVLATFAMAGWNQTANSMQIATAQLAVDGDSGNYPEFAGNVKSIEARDFWRTTGLFPPYNSQSTYNNNAETYMLTGDALGRGMIALLKQPLVTTGLSTVTTNTSTILNGSVNPNGFSSTARFEYGLTTEYGNTVSVTIDPADGSTGQQVSASLGALQPGMTYHYRLAATNELGTTYGSDRTFTTYPDAPFEVTILDETVTVTGYDGIDPNVQIPATIYGLPVVGIGDFSFANRTDLTAVTIPDGVITIGKNAFYNCTGLTTMAIPDSVTQIGDHAFSFCIGLNRVDLGAGVRSLGVGSFSFCGNLATITFGGNIIEIQEQAFAYCPSLSRAYFTGDAPVMGMNVFQYVAGGFTINHFEGAGGFDGSPWNGYPLVNMGAVTPLVIWLVERDYPHNASLQEDSNSDGVNLLMAYALDLDPKMNLISRLPKPSMEQTQMSLSFYAGKSDVSYQVESSINLVDWNSNDVTVSAPDENDIRTATISRSAPRRYLRIVFHYLNPVGNQ